MKAPLEILISTVDRDNADFLRDMFPGGLPPVPVLIVNQSDKGSEISEDKLPSGVRAVNMRGYGLSRSRNEALLHARGEFLLLADDDVRFMPGFERQVIEAHKRFDAPVLIFPAADTQDHPLGYRSLHAREIKDFTQIFSPQISLKRAWFGNNRVRFDPLFGLGARFPDSENFVFLQDVRQAGGKIFYAGGPPIVRHSHVNSSWFLENDGVFETRLALHKKYGGRLPLWAYFLKLWTGLWLRRRAGWKDLPVKWRLYRRVRSFNFG